MDSEQINGADSAHEGAYAGAGARLRAAREAQGLDLAHIAAETRIPLRHLDAIETGDFGTLPSRTYAIGFSRTYARVLGIDDTAILAAVREELADHTGRRSTVGSGMEPGDPAKLPSAGLAWFGAFAALVLAVGLIAFFGSRFGAGEGPAPLDTPSPTPAAPVAAAPAPAATSPASAGPVVLTALADGVWVRIYEEGGERLLEKQLARDESYTVPADAADPRINTGRPEALAITVGGRAVAKLAERPVTISNAPISAAALLARAEPAADAAASPVAAPSRTAVRRARPAVVPVSAASQSAEPEAAPASPSPSPSPTAQAPVVSAPEPAPETPGEDR